MQRLFKFFFFFYSRSLTFSAQKNLKLHFPFQGPPYLSLESMTLRHYASVLGTDYTLTGSHTLVGIASAVCGNLVISIALNVQRYAHLRLKENENSQHLPKNSARMPSSHKATYFRSRLWWLGALLMTVGETGNFLAYGFAPASIVSPLGVLALVSNCIVAPIFFNERITRRNLTGVGITVLGILFIIVSVQPPSATGTVPSRNSLTAFLLSNFKSELSPHEYIMFAISQLPFKIYFLVVVSLMAVLLFEENIVLDSSATISNLFTNLGLVALFGAFTALSTKALSSLLNFSLAQAAVDPLTYILILILALTAIVQVIYLNRALKIFDATMVLPVHFVLFTLSVIIGSAITFHDFENTDPPHIALFFIGCVLTFIGVALITSSPPQPTLHETQPLAGSSDQPNYSSVSSLANTSLTLPQSSRPLPKKSHSYSHGYSLATDLAIPNSDTLSASFFTPYRGDEARGSSSVGTSPNYLYPPSPHESGLRTPNPAAITSSGFFIGTMLQSTRSLEYLMSSSTAAPPHVDPPEILVEESDEGSI